MKIFLLCFLLLYILTGCSSTKDTTTSSSNDFPSVEELSYEVTKKHPVTYIQLASELFKNGEKDEAVVWYYIGQMRYRAHLMANPNLEPSGDPALYSSLKYIVGTLINEHAGSNVDNWEVLISRALQWNSSNENTFTPKDQYPEIYKEIEDNFLEFKKYVSENKKQIIEQRKSNGLSGS
jgi:hypothetical protein